MDTRIAVIGNVDSGKSTMIGVLTSGNLDDGRGSARGLVLRHVHERANGRTSCSSQHIFGFKNGSEPVHQPVAISATPKQKTAAWAQVYKNSERIITFIDLAGHEKYLKTTISGLTGCFPDYAFIVVGANMGCSKMTREHIQVAAALDVPLFVVVTKVDICPDKVLKQTLKQLAKLLKSPVCNKMPINMRKMKDVKTCFEKDPFLERICPVFLVSAVRGDGLDRLNAFLQKLTPREPWRHQSTSSCELEVDETFAVRGVGIVLSGTVTAGTLQPNTKLYLGPFSDSTFKEILVKSIHIKRVPAKAAVEGQACSVAIRFVKRKGVVDRAAIRKGMVAMMDNPKPVWSFQAHVLVLHHPTTIKCGYQPVVHCGNIRQTATITKMSKNALRSGDGALVDFRFLCHPEFVHVGRPLIIREGQTKCIGKVLKSYQADSIPSKGGTVAVDNPAEAGAPNTVMSVQADGVPIRLSMGPGVPPVAAGVPPSRTNR